MHINLHFSLRKVMANSLTIFDGRYEGDFGSWSYRASLHFSKLAETLQYPRRFVSWCFEETTSFGGSRSVLVCPATK